MRFGPAYDERTTVCLSDVLRDIMLQVLESEDINWSRAEYARQPDGAEHAERDRQRDARSKSWVLERLAALGRQEPMAVLLMHPLFAETHFAKQ